MNATVTYHIDGQAVELLTEQRDDARLFRRLREEAESCSNVEFDGAIRIRKATGSAMYLCFVGYDLQGKRHAHTTEVEFSA